MAEIASGTSIRLAFENSRAFEHGKMENEFPFGSHYSNSCHIQPPFAGGIVLDVSQDIRKEWFLRA
jgi:hypothetical protein